MSYTYNNTTTQLQRAADVGASIYEKNGILKCDGAGNISVAPVDNTPTNNSTNLVTSGGVKGAIDAVNGLVEDIAVSKTVNGNIASFNSAKSLPLKDLSLTINPTQNLNGYSYPWPAGGGKNLCPPLGAGSSSTDGINYTKYADGTIKLTDGTATQATAINIMDTSALPTGTFTISGCPSGGGESTYKLNWAYHGANDYGSGATASNTSGDAGLLRIQIASGYTVPAGGILFKPMICLSSAADPTTFAPYSNICPISGFTGANVSVVGKNLLNPSSFSGRTAYTNNGDGTITVTSTDAAAWADITAVPLIAGTYTIHAENYTSGNFQYATSEDSYTTATYVGNSASSTFTLSASGGIKVKFGTGGASLPQTIKVQIEAGSQATLFVPYNSGSTTYPISWQSEAGTVYKGYLDVTNGVLTVTHGSIILNGTQTFLQVNWRPTTNTVGWLYPYSLTNNFVPLSSEVPDAISNYMVAKTYNDLYGNNAGIGFYNTTGIGLVVKSNDTTLTTENAINTYLAANPLTVVYRLAAPQTYTISPTEVYALLGENNIYTDTNGQVSLEYLVDTETFVDEVIKANSITDTASGAIASFPDGSANPVIDLDLNIDPVQDLNGYSSPWPAGGGKNKLDITEGMATVGGVIFTNSNGVISYSGTPSANNTYKSLNLNMTNLVAGTSYKLVANSTNSRIRLREYNGSTVTYEHYSNGGAFTLDASTTKCDVYLIVDGTAGTALSGTASPIVCLASESDTTYSPYSNICPISGWTGAEIIDDPAYGGYINFNQQIVHGDFSATTSWRADNGTLAVAGNVGTYTVTTLTNDNYSNRIVPVQGIGVIQSIIGHKYYMCMDIKVPHITDVTYTLGGQYVYQANAPANTWVHLADIKTASTHSGFVACYADCRSAKGFSVNDTLQFKNVMALDLTLMFGAGNEPSTVNDFLALFPKAYYAYAYDPTSKTNVSAVNGDTYNSYNVSWQDDAGTVYTGTLSYEGNSTWKLTATHEEKDLGDLSWYASSNFFDTDALSDLRSGDDWADSICSSYKFYDPSYLASNPTTLGLTFSGSKKVRIYGTSYTTGTEVKTAVTGVKILYPLATPIVYTLTGPDPETIKGTNNWWADCGDITNVEYYADLKAYINKVVGA